MKKLLAVMISISFCFSVFSEQVQAKSDAITDEGYILTNESFDLSNEHEQTMYLEKNGKTYTISMSEELSFISTYEVVPNGSFNRIFSVSNGITSMSARMTGTCNPYITRVTSVSDGRYNSFLGAFIRDRYITKVSPSNSSIGVGYYEVDYSTYLGGTFTHGLQVVLYPGSSGAEARVGIVNL